MEVIATIYLEIYTCHIPVLHLSATFTDSQSRVIRLESGADGYLTQPVEPPVLIAAVNSLLRWF